MVNNENRCPASISVFRPRPAAPASKEIVTVREDKLAKLRKEVPEFAEALELWLGGQRENEDHINTDCILLVGHPGPHAFVLTWWDPSERK